MCECYFCGEKSSEIDAILEGWEPSFYDGDDQIDGQCCPDCSAHRLRMGADGELEVIEIPATSFGVGVTP